MVHEPIPIFDFSNNRENTTSNKKQTDQHYLCHRVFFNRE
jgi:hypothetical protein